MDTYHLSRFLTAQDSYSQYKTALEEIRNGRKRSHWMWFVFPQLKGLGHSYNADYYGIAGADEARAYWLRPHAQRQIAGDNGGSVSVGRFVGKTNLWGSRRNET